MDLSAAADNLRPEFDAACVVAVVAANPSTANGVAASAPVVMTRRDVSVNFREQQHLPTRAALHKLLMTSSFLGCCGLWNGGVYYSP